MDKAFLEELAKNPTPVYQDFSGYQDADEELKPIAEYIKKHTQHNEYVEPDRIKFLYSDKPKKDGGRYALFNLIYRSDIEKMINDEFDFVITVFYSVWKDLLPEHKVIALDKALCGIDMGSMESPKIGKKAPDSKEYVDNMNYFGPDKVMKLSEMVDLACERIVEEKKEQEKNKKKKVGLEQQVEAS